MSINSKLGPIFYLIQHPGTLRFIGETKKDYLQRQTTNDMDVLSASRALPNLLTSASGRILEVFTLIEDGDDILMLTQPGHGPGLAEYFAKRIFFNDQVSIKDESANWAQVELIDGEAETALKALGFEKAPELDEVVAATNSEGSMRAVGESPFGDLPRYRLLYPIGANAQLGTAIDFAQREQLRIEAGVAGDPEFQNEYTPFELGMERLVSASKGCYTGQEVLARQVTYDKVMRRLCGVKADKPLAGGYQLLTDGKTAGQISSAAGKMGLAVLRKPQDKAGTKLLCKASGGLEFPVTVL